VDTEDYDRYVVLCHPCDSMIDSTYLEIAKMLLYALDALQFTLERLQQSRVVFSFTDKVQFFNITQIVLPGMLIVSRIFKLGFAQGEPFISFKIERLPV